MAKLLATLAVALASFALLVLTAGCGGNGDETARLEHEPHMSTQPVDCSTTPERCK